MNYSSSIQTIPLNKLNPRRIIEFTLLHSIINYELPYLPGVVIAGGAIRNLFDKEDVIHDIDLFFLGSAELAKNTIEKTKQFYIGNGLNVIFECPEGKLITLIDETDKTKVQLINDKTNYTVYDILNNFDFNACRFAIYEGILYYNRAGIKDIKGKELSLYSLTYPVATLKRVYKYQNKGYCVNECLVDIVRTINSRGNTFDDESMRIYID